MEFSNAAIYITIITMTLLVNYPHLSKPEVSPTINLACKATQFPDLCESSLSGLLPPNATPQEIIRAATKLSSDAAIQCHTLSIEVLAAAWANSNITAVAKNCVEFLVYSVELVAKSSSTASPDEITIKDAIAWMSAAIAYQYDCAAGLSYVNTSLQINSLIQHLNSAANLTSNALSMLDALDTYGNDTVLWRPPITERSDSNSTHKTADVLELNQERYYLGVLLSVPNVTVSKDGGSVSSVQDAVNGAPDYSAQRFVIHIKAGIYEEIVRVPRSKTNLVFVGEGSEKTIIRGSRYVPSLPGAVTVYDSATTGINGDGFVAWELTFENTYPGPKPSEWPKTHQAVALRVDSDRSAFFNCRFLSHQDTLYTHTLRQFYKNCTIEGTNDFIFGNAAAVFHQCSIRVRPRQLKSKSGESDPVTAHGRTDPAQSTGLVFNDCSVNGTDEYMKDFRENPSVHRVYLGRPWKMYSRTVFLNSFLGEVVRPEGWMPWNGTFALDTLFYGEFRNYGGGANISGRVPWSNQISENNVGRYSIRSFIQGDRWLAATAY